MGEVYRAIDTRLDRAVAIKTTRDQFSDRFEREARAISSLNHPNICTLYDVGPNYLVMELVDGDTIAARLGSGPIPVETALLYASQIVAALSEAHARGIVHRDLKPANIMIAKSGIKVLDSVWRNRARMKRLPPAAWYWERQPTWRPSKGRASRPMPARTYIRLAGSYTRC